MIDLVAFSDDAHHSWVRRLGFHQFLPYKHLHVVLGGDEEKNLKAVKDRSVDVLFPESAKGKDSLHWRRSGLNQVLLRLAKKNRVAIGFSLCAVLDHKGEKRGLVLGRMMQNVFLCRKYEVGMVLCSFAHDLWGLRSASDLASFGRVIGMTPGEVKNALHFERKNNGVRILSAHGKC